MVRTKGSHCHFRHPEKTGIVTIKHPEKDTPAGTANNILRQAGLK
jgi:predicted RNA binding protein YcfA (HicA-like mRNA interferase family)